MLIVIDENVNRRVITETLLRSRGYAVRSAQDAEVACEIARRDRASLVMMDACLAEEADWTALGRATGGPSPVPVVVLSERAADLFDCADDQPGFRLLGGRADGATLLDEIENAFGLGRAS